MSRLAQTKVSGTSSSNVTAVPDWAKIPPPNKPPTRSILETLQAAKNVNDNSLEVCSQIAARVMGLGEEEAPNPPVDSYVAGCANEVYNQAEAINERLNSILEAVGTMEPKAVHRA
jgi:hypothetical protein